MRMLVRLTALAVLSVTGLLIVGHGEWLIRSADPGVAPGVLAGGLVVGASLAMIRPLRRGIGQLVTLLHELGHTVVAAALGASPGGIVLRHDTSGHATSRWVGRATPLRRFALAAIAFAGFPAAAAVSAAGARLLLLAGPRAVLWSIAAAGLVVAALARSAWSLLIAGGVVGLAVASLSDRFEPWAGGLVVGLLTAIALTTVSDGLRAIRRPIQRGDDASVAGGYVWLPPRFVQLAQVTLAGALGGWAVWLLASALPVAT